MTRQWFSMHGIAAALALAVIGVGCAGSDGSAGPPGPAGTAGLDASGAGTLAGTVKDAYGNLVAGAKVSFTVGNEAATTVSAGADGRYAVAFPPGARTVSFSGTGYVTFSQSVEVRPGQTMTLNVNLNPNDRAAVNVAATAVSSSAKGPGSAWTLTPTVAVFDPTLVGRPIAYTWSVVSGPAPTFSATNVASPTVTLASRAGYKAALAEVGAPLYKVNPDEAPMPVDRYQVLPLSYEQALSIGNTTKLKLVASIGGDTFETTVSIAATLPFTQSNGLANVPVNNPVILQGQFPFKDANGALIFAPKSSWSWEVTLNGAPVALSDATGPYPDFVPSTAGSYVVREGGVDRFTLVAGSYVGVATGPGTLTTSCTGCHRGAPFAPDKFTPWKTSGHKNVIWAGIEELPPGGHYAKTCTPCHTVGQQLTGSGGYADRTATPATNPDFATTLQGSTLAEETYWRLYPTSAPLAGIQCENCHGPQGSDAHPSNETPGLGSSRITYSSNTCGTCHARRPTHGRFPQWAGSAHGSFATFTFNASAADGSLSAGCACCHSAQGFAAYRAILPTANGNRSLTTLPPGLTVANAQPITCPTCHVSHDEGDAGKVEWNNLAQVGPTEGSTYMLPSGFAATGVGKGALCIACHNSRQGYKTGVGPRLHEDGDSAFGTLTSYGAPHEACQGDVLLGRNAYWLGVATYDSPTTRSKHSYITDTCVTCHMELTDPAPGLANAGQTRHDWIATANVCNNCHTAYSTEAVQAAFIDRFDDLRTAVGTAILNLKYNGAIPADTTAKLVANRSGMLDVTAGGATHRWFLNDKTGQDAFVWDPNFPGTTQAVAGCSAPVLVDGAWVADCTGFLHGAPGYAGAGLDPTLTDTAVTSSGVNGVVAKALWNAVLVQDDASKGVHNPSFTFDVIDQTIVHVKSFQK